MSDKATEICVVWLKALHRALDADAWGQPLEAIEGYQRLSKQLYTYARNKESQLFSDEQKKTLEKIALCMESRLGALEANITHKNDGVTLADIKELEKTLESLFVNPTKFPVDVSVASSQLKNLTLAKRSLLEKTTDRQKSGSLLPKPLPTGNMTYMSIALEDLFIKDASQYLDSYISITLRDSSGIELTARQDTPFSPLKTDASIVINSMVHIQNGLECFPEDFAIFFELRHYKPKKAKTSTKCWALLEKDEIKDGPLALELYKKPTDFQRKNLRLLTSKPLYLQIKISLFK